MIQYFIKLLQMYQKFCDIFRNI